MPLRRHGGFQFDRRPVRQSGTDGLQRRQRPVVQNRFELPHHAAAHPRPWPSIGPPGAASAWPPAARSRKSWRWPGIDMLPPEAGIPWIRRELTAEGASGEVVVAGRLGVMMKAWDADGGLEQSALAHGPMTAGAARVDLNGRLTVETTLDPAVQGFLRDHAIEGTPLLPGVMGIEAFAETALAVSPGWHVEAVEDVDFLAPLKFYRNEPRTAAVEAEFHREGGMCIAGCRLTAQRNLPNQAEPQVTTHFTGRVRLAMAPHETEAGPVPGPFNEPAIQSADIYRLYFHGPAYQVLKQAWCHETGAVGELRSICPLITSRAICLWPWRRGSSSSVSRRRAFGRWRSSSAWGCHGTSIAFGWRARPRRWTARCTRWSRRSGGGVLRGRRSGSGGRAIPACRRLSHGDLPGEHRRAARSQRRRKL